MRAAATAVVLMIGLAGCASSDANAPTWLAAGPTAEEEGYPSLREVPQGTSANTDAAHWAGVEGELTAAGRDVRANPRAAPATQTQSPEQFLAEARRDLEETRQSHEP